MPKALKHPQRQPLARFVFHELLDVLSYIITFDIDRIPWFFVHQYRLLSRMRDKRNGETRICSFRHGKADAVYGDRAFFDYIAQDFR